MIRINKFFLLLFFFFIFTTYNFNERQENTSFIFPIKKIKIKNTLAVDLIKIKRELKFLTNTSLFFLNKKKLLKLLIVMILFQVFN